MNDYVNCVCMCVCVCVFMCVCVYISMLFVFVYCLYRVDGRSLFTSSVDGTLVQWTPGFVINKEMNVSISL